MPYVQLKAPNLAVKGTPGLCLVYSRDVFDVLPKYPTAADAWRNASYKHTGNPPTDVVVPVWFSWKPSGHVAVSVPGKGIYSTTAQGVKVFDSVQECASYVKATYLGWSEDIDGVRVVQVKQGGKAVITKEDENAMSILATGSYPGKDYNYKFTGTNDLDGMINFWLAESKSSGLLSK